MPGEGVGSERGEERFESPRMPPAVAARPSEDDEGRLRNLLQQVSEANFSKETFASIFKENYMNAIEQHHAEFLNVEEPRQRPNARPSSAPMNRGRRAKKTDHNVSDTIVNAGVRRGASHKKRPLSASRSRAAQQYQQQQHQQQHQQQQQQLASQLRVREKQLESKAERIERRKEAVRAQMELFRAQEKQLQKEEQEVEQQRRQLSPKRRSHGGGEVALTTARGNPVSVARTLAQSQSANVLVTPAADKELSREESEKARMRLYANPRQQHQVSKHASTQHAQTMHKRATPQGGSNDGGPRRGGISKSVTTKLYDAPSSTMRITKECLASIAESSTPLRGVVLPSRPIEEMHEQGGALAMVRKSGGKREDRPLQCNVVCESNLHEPRSELVNSLHLTCVLFDLNMQVFDIVSLYSAGAHPSPKLSATATPPVVPTQVAGIALGHNQEWQHNFKEAPSKQAARAPSKFGSRYDRKPSPLRGQAEAFPSDGADFEFSRTRTLASMCLSDLDSNVFAVAFLLERPPHMDSVVDGEAVAMHVDIVAEEKTAPKRRKKKDGGQWSQSKRQTGASPPPPPPAEEDKRHRLMQTSVIELRSGECALMGCVFRHSSNGLPWYSNALSLILPGPTLVSRLPMLVASLRHRAVVPYKLLHIEHCCDCDKHTMGTWHVPGSYESLAAKVTQSVVDELPSTLVICNAHKPKKSVATVESQAAGSSGTVVEARSQPPRLGSFEIVLQAYGSGRRTLVYSKISSRSFPTTRTVVQAVAQLCRPRKVRLGRHRNITVQIWDAYYSAAIKSAKVQLVRVAVLEGERAESDPHAEGIGLEPAVVVKDWKKGRGLPPQRHAKDTKKLSEGEVAALRNRQLSKERRAMSQVMLASRSPAVASVLAWGENDVLSFLSQHGVQGTPDYGMLNEFRSRGIVNGGKLLALTDRSMQDIGLNRRDVRTAVLATLARFKRQNGVALDSTATPSLVPSEHALAEEDDTGDNAIDEDSTEIEAGSPAANTSDGTDGFVGGPLPGDEYGDVDMEHVAFGESDDHGQCSFQVMETGCYVVNVVLDGFESATSRIIRVEDGPDDAFCAPDLRVSLLPVFNRIEVQVKDDREPPRTREEARSAASLEGLVISLFNWRSEQHHRAVTDRHGRVDWPALPTGDYLMNVGMQSLRIGPTPNSANAANAGKIVVSAVAAIARNASKNKDAVVSMKGGGGAGWSDPKIWAVATIQALLRRFILERRGNREISAIKLQTAYRCYALRWRYEAGKRVRVATRSILLTQKFARRMILRQQWKDLKNGVLKLQSCARRFLVNVREEIRFRNAMKIQAWARRRRVLLGTVVRQVINEKAKAATTLQSVWRGTGIRQYYQDTILQSVLAIQRAVRARQYEKFQGKMELRLVQKRGKFALDPPFAALIVQAVWRSHRARARTPPFLLSLEMKYSRAASRITVPQSDTRQKLLSRRGIVTEAATRIQCRWHGFRLRWLLWLINNDAFQFSYVHHGWYQEWKSGV